MSAATCPRCAGPLHDPLLDDDSRLPSPSYIGAGPEPLCFECRLDETYRHVMDARYIPPDEWPIAQGAHDYVVTSELDPDLTPPPAP